MREDAEVKARIRPSLGQERIDQAGQDSTHL